MRFEPVGGHFRERVLPEDYDHREAVCAVAVGGARAELENSLSALLAQARMGSGAQRLNMTVAATSAPAMTVPTFTIEDAHAAPVIGVDEAGRGPLAGPVVAAAVVLDRACVPAGVNDSKKLCARRREDLCGAIRASALVGVGVASVAEIDSINIYHATMLAMARAVDALVTAARCDPAMVLVDGNALPKWRYPAKAVVGGDALCLSIAAASIVAKHERDRMMLDYDAAHPGYGWARNKGYGTAAHLAALGALGPTPIHRRSFAPVRQLLLL